MPPLVRAAIQDLVREVESHTPRASEEARAQVDGFRASSFEAVLPAALAALVVRQARMAVMEGRPISGVDRLAGDQVGLNREDRHAMALVSRARLRLGLSDVGAEIHELLFHCTRPLGEWLPLPSIHADRLSDVVLLDSDEGVPTREAEELAQRFVSATASIEELIFGRFREQLTKSSRLAASSYYTRVREFVVRHPVATGDQLAKIAAEVPSAIGILINQQFYEPVPQGWAVEGKLPICGHCANALEANDTGYTCRTRACADTLPSSQGALYALEDSLRLTRGLRQYWQEPGFDEVRVFDALIAAGFNPVLYPQFDRVDIEVGDVGIDLKAYVSPELLASRLERNIGGLAHYRHKLLVVPDRLIRRVPAYLERLQVAMPSSSVRAVPASGVIGVIKELAFA